MEPTISLDGKLTGASSYETAVQMTRVAQDSDIDELGHVNNAVYLVWAQDIAVAHWRHVAGEKLVRDLVWVALRHEIDYRDQVLAGDAVDIRTWLGRVSGPRFIRHVDIRKPGATRFSAKVQTDWCLIDAASRKPRRIGAEILEPFGLS
ncbi:acyl-CoA thioesterase [Hyphococcus sp.]|uniref:acyl-CoA thioesterase n=1 Tax=Hyphococcus sp. TaxID=2038636 RepID=UPI0020876B92|nr:MAG: thioesterase [Marinicaulis sp.]